MILEREWVRRQMKGDRKVDRALTSLMKLGEKRRTPSAWGP